MQFRRLRIAALLSAAGVLATAPELHPASLQPAVIRGRIAIGIPIAVPRATSTYSRSISSSELAPVSELRSVVVYLKDAPAEPMPRAPRTEIRQVKENFVPKVVAIPVGSEVAFPNDDPIYHNVFSLSRVKTFNLGRYPKGQSRNVRFDKPGVVRIFCDIHSHMTTTVMVFNHPWFAIPDEDGRFELPAVPAGDYGVTAWHERLGDTTLTVRVEAGQAATADFVLPVPHQ